MQKSTILSKEWVKKIKLGGDVGRHIDKKRMTLRTNLFVRKEVVDYFREFNQQTMAYVSRIWS